MSFQSVYRFNSVRSRMIFFFLILLIPTFVIFSYLGERYTRKAIFDNVIEKARSQALISSYDINDLNSNISERAQKVAEMLQSSVSEGIKNAESEIVESLKENSSIYGMAIALLPKYSPDGNEFCIYYYQTKNGIKKKNLILPHYDYQSFEWFRKPVDEKHDYWSKPYFDKGGGNIWMSTYSTIISDKKGNIIGVATADVSTEYLSELVSKIKLLKTGRAFIVSVQGDILAPTGDYVSGDSNVAAVLEEYKKAGNDAIVNDMTGKMNRYIIKKIDGREYFVFYIPIKKYFVMAFVFDSDELLFSLKDLNRNYIILSMVGILLFVLLTLVVSRKVTEDFLKIKDTSSHIACGDFDTPIPSGLTAEAGDVAEALRKMQNSLKEYINKVEENARIENELEYARKIQQLFIPNRFIKNIGNASFVAVSEWAEQVGGDFYGVKKITDEKTLIYLGDVSGKGIPASLFVAIIKSMLENVSSMLQDPKQIIETLNDYISELSKNYMFATIFIGVVDHKYNKMSFCNAGHNPPIVFGKNGFLRSPLLTNDAPVGFMKEYKYSEVEYDLDDIECIILFSDGITDAQNKDREMFGVDRFTKVLQNLQINDLESAIENILKKQKDFVGNEKLYDDTTLLAIKIGSSLFRMGNT